MELNEIFLLNNEMRKFSKLSLETVQVCAYCAIVQISECVYTAKELITPLKVSSAKLHRRNANITVT